MSPWNAAVHLTYEETLLLVTDLEGNELLKARLPAARHPRALLAVLEGLALWSGKPIRGALTAVELASVSFHGNPYGVDLWPLEKP